MSTQGTPGGDGTPRKEEYKKDDSLYADLNWHADPTINPGQGLDSAAKRNPDGRISLVFDFKNGTSDMSQDHAHDAEEFGVDKKDWSTCPSMNIVIMIVGSRGDVQPYVALGKELLKDGHRIRIATHETFRQFVLDAGLEFFNIGGSPQDLMSYMVKNPGLMPGFESLTNGDIAKKRKMLAEMINGCWHSCYLPCPVDGRAFAANAIIANPPAFAHVHCAEALGIPLLLSFTMPWTPTVAFAHPLVNITSNASFGMSNYLSYAAADLLTWQGVGDIINAFRTSKLGLPPLNIRSGPGYVDRLRVPWTYCMSPALVPKPEDWKNNIDVAGFYFLTLAKTYQPPSDLMTFLEAGEPPVYIGFGSVVVDDPAALTQNIFEATEQAGVRALVSSGWGGLGGISPIPPHIFMLGNIPHDWLFDQGRVVAVVHHGGAGTTAIGLAKGRPTVVVPFFGDQGFWGHMIHKSGAGPEPIPHNELSVSKLREALKYAISPIAKEAAAQLSQKIHHENGVRGGVDSFYKHLPLLNMRCDLDPSRLAIWWSKEQCLKLSAFAAQTLADAKLISIRDLVLHRPKEYRPHNKSPAHMNNGAGAVFWSLTHHAKISGALQSAVTKADTFALSGAHSIMDAMNSMHEGLKSHHDSLHKVDEVPEGKSGSPQRGLASLGKEAHKKEGLIEALMHLVTPKRATNSAQTTMPIQGTWDLLQTASGKNNYNRQRLTRIAEGRQDVKLSTEALRNFIIDRFRIETNATPLRRKLYRDAWEARGRSSTDLNIDTSKSNTPNLQGSSSVLTQTGLQLVAAPQGSANDEDETIIFVREMELATKLSQEEYEHSQALAAQV